MFSISAQIEGFGTEAHNICCFDPTIVVFRLRQAFPEIIIGPDDHAWRDCAAFTRMNALEPTLSSRAPVGIDGALRIAERDARRRGPLWTFELPLPDGRTLPGSAERHNVSFQSSQSIPEPYRSRILDFFHEMQFAPCVSVKSVEIQGSNEIPA